MRADLNGLFRESKNFYNHSLNVMNNLYEHTEKDWERKIVEPEAYHAQRKNLSTELSKSKTVEVLLPDTTIEERNITLAAQIKQSILKRVDDNIKGLGVTKKKGNRVGKLKFVRSYDSIPLKQLGTTFDINPGHVRIAKVWHLKVKGLHQIPAEVEISNATLIRRASGYYIHITCFVQPNPTSRLDEEIGIDMGIATAVTLSNGISFDIVLPEDRRLKRAQRHFNKAYEKLKKLNVKKGCNHFKRKQRVKRQYEKLKNRRKQIHTKVVSYLKQFKTVATQKESIAAWHKSKLKGHGRRVQHTWIWALRAKIVALPQHLEVGKWTPTTKPCSACGSIQAVGLEERTYICKDCGYTLDRDTNAAINILQIATKNHIPPEQRKFKLVEINASTLLSPMSIEQALSMKQEATCFSLW